LPILDRAELSSGNAQLYVFSVMLQPRVAEAQQRLYRAFVRAGTIRLIRNAPAIWPTCSHELQRRLHEQLVDWPSLEDVQPLWARGREPGRHAGRLLRWCLEHHAGITAACRHHTKPRLGLRTQLDLWAAAQPAAHLWAAALDSPIPGDDRLGPWLMEAEELRAAGEAFVALHSKTSILDPRETWRLP